MIATLEFAEFPDHISIDYDLAPKHLRDIANRLWKIADLLTSARVMSRATGYIPWATRISFPTSAIALVICTIVTLIESHMNELKKRGIPCACLSGTEAVQDKKRYPLLFGLFYVES